MWLLSKLAASTTLEEATLTFRDLCRLALSHATVDDLADEAKKHSDSVTEEDSEVDGSEPPEGGALRDSTPFGLHFKSIEAEVRRTIDLDVSITNPFHAPDVVKHLQTTYMPLLPLWTGIQTPNHCLPSNARVESFFKTLKKNLLRSRTGMLAGDFLRLLLTDLSARVKDDIIIDRMRGTKQGKPTGGKRAKEGQMNECPYGAKEKWLKRNPKAKPYRMQKAPPSFVRLNEVRNDKQGHGNQKQRQGEKNKRKNPEGSDEDDLDVEQEKKRPKADQQQSNPCGEESTKDTETDDFGDRTMIEKTKEIGDILVDSASFTTLEGREWLDDAVIDAYLLLAAQESSETVATFSVHTLPKMAHVCTSRSHTALIQERYGNVFASHAWLVPYNTITYNRQRHWVLFVVYPWAKRVMYFDSLIPPKPAKEAIEDLMVLIIACQGAMTWTGWRVIYPKQVRQVDGSSCGVFVCARADALCNQTPMDVPQDETAQLRYIRRWRQNIKTRLKTAQDGGCMKSIFIPSTTSTRSPRRVLPRLEVVRDWATDEKHQP
ncbi:uncharacterized protein LOC122368475 [Amphibalanus amphitrite]|uniref:uncharacterized protein LOC122368475 n=1 Tax=Amphibalanus amphitrite TaxID=1232801 RepID=UPI001C91811C|nr:uncharacterized protein LOC122368475 [Amphibalanus amphitrite]